VTSASDSKKKLKSGEKSSLKMEDHNQIKIK
jgi:hypothetical protein